MDILKLIPQLFFDLISRVVPGSIAVFMLVVAADVRLGRLTTELLDGVPALQQSALFLGLGFIGGAYVVGQLLAPLSDLVEKKLVRRLLPSYFQVLEDSVSSDTSYLPDTRKFFLTEMGFDTAKDLDNVVPSQYRQALFVWYDWLRVNNPDAGARAAKTRAGYRMHSQNVVAFMLPLLIHIALAYFQYSTLKPALVVATATAGLISLWATARTYRTFSWAVLNQYYAARKPVAKEIGSP